MPGQVIRLEALDAAPRRHAPEPLLPRARRVDPSAASAALFLRIRPFIESSRRGKSPLAGLVAPLRRARAAEQVPLYGRHRADLVRRRAFRGVRGIVSHPLTCSCRLAAPNRARADKRRLGLRAQEAQEAARGSLRLHRRVAVYSSCSCVVILSYTDHGCVLFFLSRCDLQKESALVAAAGSDVVSCTAPGTFSPRPAQNFMARARATSLKSQLLQDQHPPYFYTGNYFH